MNKRTKRVSVALVAVLCFLLVFALGFGLTGAWYKASRSASGTVTLNQGIKLAFTNIGGLTDGDLVDKDSEGNRLPGKLLVSEGTDVALENLSIAPGQTVALKNPTIAAATGSIDFYVRARVVYTVSIKDVTDPVTLDAENLAKILGTDGAIKFASTWKAGTDGWNYLGTGDTTITLTKVAPSDANPTKLFLENEGKVNLTFADWAKDVDLEAGGPTVNYGTDNAQSGQVTNVQVTLEIEVIQAPNMTNDAIGATGAGWAATVPAV